MLPFWLAQGRLSFSAFGTISLTEVFYISVPILAVLVAKREWAAPLLVLCIVAAGFYLKIVSFPVLDRDVSARGFWHSMKASSDKLCDGGVNRDWTYGISYYRGALLPPCHGGHAELRLRSEGHGRPVILPTK
jgi:hypothetical protein